ncbi:MULTISPECIES: transposase [unclassified Corynebacterium]|uniref:transposase n=1 Tax=unclassified Corynebacterium TaxID=2624378 RepID=UPI0005560FF0|nr:MULTISPECIES: transposase [unclassified Corynebacterium]
MYQHARVKVYTEQFKRDAVAMFGASPDASMRKVAEELGINRSALGYWYKQFGTNVAAKDAGSSPAAKLADAERIRQLKRENKRLREEREILRKAAKYFAEEPTW